MYQKATVLIIEINPSFKFPCRNFQPLHLTIIGIHEKNNFIVLVTQSMFARFLNNLNNKQQLIINQILKT